MINPQHHIRSQRAFFYGRQIASMGRTLRASLHQLEAYLQKELWNILSAIETDLGQAPYEVYVTQFLPVLRRLKYLKRHVTSWLNAKNRLAYTKVGTLSQKIQRQPYGVVLITCDFAEPLKHIFFPLLDAMTAGNVIILRPHPLWHHTSQVFQTIFQDLFPPQWLYYDVDCLPLESWMKAKPDFVFYTALPAEGKLLRQLGAMLSIPVFGQVGGKSPCIVSEHVSIEQAAQKIVWAKWLNVGQNLNGLDFVWVHESVRADLIEAMIQILRNTYGIDPTHNPEYQSMANAQWFMHLRQSLNHGRILWGGRSHAQILKIEPTIIDHVTWDHPLMRTPVRGPVLPILSYENLNQIIQQTIQLPVPPATFFFSNDELEIDQFVQKARYANLAVNEASILDWYPQWTKTAVGKAGQGSLGALDGLQLFSYPKLSLVCQNAEKMPQRYPPYPRRWHRLKRR